MSEKETEESVLSPFEKLGATVLGICLSPVGVPIAVLMAAYNVWAARTLYRWFLEPVYGRIENSVFIGVILLWALSKGYKKSHGTKALTYEIVQPMFLVLTGLLIRVCIHFGFLF